MVMSRSFDTREARAAAVAPPATPPTITSFCFFSGLLVWPLFAVVALAAERPRMASIDLQRALALKALELTAEDSMM
eukprot:scaffold7151_cov159-Ochromonas_danica.AAC.8